MFVHWAFQPGAHSLKQKNFSCLRGIALGQQTSCLFIIDTIGMSLTIHLIHEAPKDLLPCHS